VTPGAVQTQFMGGGNMSSYRYQDGFVAKPTPDGGDLVFGTYFGSSGEGVVRDIDGDAAGNIYVSGMTCSDDFPVTADVALESAYGGARDAIVFKLSPDADEVL